MTYSQGTSLYNYFDPGSLPPIRPQITTLRKRLSTVGQQRGYFKARSLSNGSLPDPYCGSTENVRFRYDF